MRRLLTTAATTLVAATTALGLAAGSATAATATPIGSAYDIKATILGIGIQPAPLSQGTAANGWTDSQQLLNFAPSVLGSSLTFGVMNTSTTGNATTDAVTSSARISNAAVTVGTPPFGIPELFKFGATALSSTCSSTPTSFSGSSTLTGGTLFVDGFGAITVPVNPAPNTGVDLGLLGKVLFNEQVVNADGSITVNAFHIQLATAAGVDFVLGSSTCGPTTRTTVGVPNHTTAVAGAAGGAVLAGVVTLVAVRRRRDQADDMSA